MKRFLALFAILVFLGAGCTDQNNYFTCPTEPEPAASSNSGSSGGSSGGSSDSSGSGSPAPAPTTPAPPTPAPAPYSSTLAGTWERRIVTQTLGDPSVASVVFTYVQGSRQESVGESGTWRFSEVHTSGNFNVSGTYSLTGETLVVTASSSNHPSIPAGSTYRGRHPISSNTLGLTFPGLPGTVYTLTWVKLF